MTARTFRAIAYKRQHFIRIPQFKIIPLMKPTEKPPKKKPARRENVPDTSPSRPAAAERTDAADRARVPEPSGNPSEEEVISNLTHPVTNQDEQDKITNTDGKDIPIADK